jgi:hypothetical protein
VSDTIARVSEKGKQRYSDKEEKPNNGKTNMRAPPYLGAPKFANAISNPPGYLVLASGGNVICKGSVLSRDGGAHPSYEHINFHKPSHAHLEASFLYNKTPIYGCHHTK